MEMQVGQRALEHLALRLHGVDPGDRTRVETELRETLAAFPELDPSTIQQLHSMANAAPTAGWYSAFDMLLSGEAPMSVREAMASWGVPVQEDWSKWARTWRTATISPALAYATPEQAVRMAEENRTAHERDMSTMRGRFDQIISEIDRVQSRDPLGRRRLLLGIEQTIREPAPKIADAIAAALRAIPSDPGFSLDGAAANRAEELLLDAVRVGLSKPSAGPDGPQVEEMKDHLFRLASRNGDPYTLDPSELRLQSLLVWYLLPAYGTLTGRTKVIEEKGRPPSQQPDEFQDRLDYERNFAALREMRDIDRAVNRR